MKRVGPWWGQPALIRVIGVVVFWVLAKMNKQESK